MSNRWGIRPYVYLKVSGCQVPIGIDQYYVQSICGIPHTYSIFDTGFEREFYRCSSGADQWLICLDEFLGHSIKSYVENSTAIP